MIHHPIGRIIYGGLAAGVAIGIAGLAYLKTGSAWVFPIGLFMVCFFSLYLYTGRICYAKLEDTRDLILMLLCNFIGAALVGIFAHFNYPELAQKATELAAVKLNEGWWVIPRAILCNIMIFTAVHSWKTLSKPNDIIGLIFATAVFVMCGFEHCVANAFYFACAGTYEIGVIWFLLLNALGNTIGGLAAYRSLKWYWG